MGTEGQPCSPLMTQQIPAKQSTKPLKRFFQMMGTGMNSLNFSQPSMTICLKASHHSRIFNRTTHRSGRYPAEGFPLSAPTTIPKPESRQEVNVRMLTIWVSTSGPLGASHHSRVFSHTSCHLGHGWVPA
jgi:hypothetical protein